MDFYKKLNVPMSQPNISDLEIELVNSVLKSDSLSMGPYLREFEERIAAAANCNHAIAVNSGTAGLHCCVRAAGWGAGDYVITSPFSFVASVNALLYEGVTPILVDVDPLSGNIDPALVSQAVEDLANSGEAGRKWLPEKNSEPNGTLRGILAVDVFGQPADYDALNETAQRANLKVIEDSCEAIGAAYKGRPAGSLADCGVFAFYPNKQITTGEGGVVVTNDADAAMMIRALRNQGRSPSDTWLDHTYLGFNYRMDEMSAALGVAQLRRLPSLLEARSQVADWYEQELKDIPGIELPHKSATTTYTSWFVYVIWLERSVNRNEVIRRLDALGIPSRPYFSPIHLQPYMAEKFGYQAGAFPIAEDLGTRGLAIPFSSKLTQEQIYQVASALRQVL